MLVMEQGCFVKISAEGFSVLDSVRELKFGESSATLSIGVGLGAETLAECEDRAGQALDMALGRGGDQAVVKSSETDYKFYGGVSGAIEKHNKVRARIISNTLKGLILSSSKVILMGHRFADLDSFGACLALSSAVTMLGRESFIVMDKQKDYGNVTFKQGGAAGLRTQRYLRL